MHSPQGDPRFAEVEETISFTLAFPSGFMANCLSSYGARDDKYQRLNLETASIDMPNAYLYRGQQMVVTGRQGDAIARTTLVLTPRNQFAAEIDHMAECVRTGRKPRTPRRGRRAGPRDHGGDLRIRPHRQPGRPAFASRHGPVPDHARRWGGLAAMQWLLIAFAGVTGVLNTVQAGSNTTLNKALGAPIWSAAAVFLVALTTTVTAALIGGQRFPSVTLQQVPWWAWIGGVFGALYIVAMMIVAKQVGAAVFMAVTVTAAILTSLTMDHFGLMGFDVRAAGLGRIAGAVAIVGGLCLIVRY